MEPPWSPESPPFSPPHIHTEETEDFASAESQSVRDPEDLYTPDSVDGDSTDVSNPYRNIRWTDAPPRTTQTEVEAEAETGEEGPTSAFPDAHASSPSHALDPVTIIGSRGEAAIYPEPNGDEHQGITLPPYDANAKYDDEEAQDEEEEDIHIPPNPSNVPTPEYRPVRDRSLYPLDSPSPELMELKTGSPTPTPDPPEP